jgi:hypothetical protein
VPHNKTGQGSSTGARAPVFGPCYNCNQPRHFAKYCPHPKKKQIVYHGHVNYTMVEEILEGEPVTAGTYESTPCCCFV